MRLSPYCVIVDIEMKSEREVVFPPHVTPGVVYEVS